MGTVLVRDAQGAQRAQGCCRRRARAGAVGHSARPESKGDRRQEQGIWPQAHLGTPAAVQATVKADWQHGEVPQ